MRLFWIIVGVLAVAAVALVFASGGDGGNDRIGNDHQATPAPAPRPEPEPSNVDAGKTADATAGASDATPHTPTVAPADAGTIEESQATALVDDLLDSSSRQQPRESIDEALDERPAIETNFDPENPVDGKYILSGAGTADDPFEITWDLLLLASETYQPRYGKTDIPPQVAAMDGKHIKIDGYFAFPLASTDARELLFMLNMWDGCCIGMPPSPYDAIEVRLKEPMAGGGRKQWVNYGTLTGTLKVDPYVQEGWLLGMYLLEDGAVDVGM